MNIFENKRIIVGITGSIAAYKGLSLVRELVKRNAVVYPVMTPSAEQFITRLTLTNLAKNPVVIDMFDLSFQQGGAWHIHYAHSVDLMVVAPCTATTIGKIANGICDNSLVAIATALPQNIPLIIAPAMDSTMLQNPATQRNLSILQSFGYRIIPSEKGELASGYYGEGRLPEINSLLQTIEISLWEKYFKNAEKENYLDKLKNKRILISAGPTYEKIDDVRYIGNFSTGKMGFALANVAKYFGAEITLVSGPSCISTNVDEVIKVFSSDEMFEVISNIFSQQDIIIMASAVADFKPKKKVSGKIKKNFTMKHLLTLELESTKDILSFVGKNKMKNQFVVGFALEELKSALENAKEKLINKNCDLLVLNYLGIDKSGFESDYNTITIIRKVGEKIVVKKLDPFPKIYCAFLILNEIGRSI